MRDGRGTEGGGARALAVVGARGALSWTAQWGAGVRGRLEMRAGFEGGRRIGWGGGCCSSSHRVRAFPPGQVDSWFASAPWLCLLGVLSFSPLQK